MTLARDLQWDVTRNGVTTFLKYTDPIAGAEHREFGSLTAVSIGFPVQLYNQIFIPELPVRENLEAAVQWIANRDVPFRVSLPE